MKRRSVTTIVVYWFAILAGLALFTVTRRHDVDVAGMWIGVVGGGALGQFLAARAVRLWFVAVLLVGFLILCGPFTPAHDNGMLFWMAMIPATLCGWMSLSDRGSLVAFWFPAVIWMLSILDRGKGALKIESGSAALLGGLAFMFVAFLYARETRRLDLWRTVAPTPIAPATPPVILREVPRLRISLAGWSLVVSGVAFAVCAWLAPRLWHVEALVPELHVSAVETPPRPSKMCCHDLYMMREQKRARVKEYFDIGRGHDADEDDADAQEMLSGGCVVCGPDNKPIDASRYGVEGWVIGQPCFRGDGTAGYRDDTGLCVEPCNRGNGLSGYRDTTGECVALFGPGEYGLGGGGGYGTGGAGGDGTSGAGGEVAGGYSPSYTPSRPSLPSYTPPPTQAAPMPPPRIEPQIEPPKPAQIEPRIEPPKPAEIEPRIEPQIEPPKPAQIEPPKPPKPPAVEPPAVEPPAVEPSTVEPSTVQPPSPQPVDSLGTRDPAASAPPSTTPPPSTPRPSTTTTAATPTAGAQQASSPTDGPPILAWVLVVLAGGLAFQVLALGLRPVRRLLTLRHLRKPFWSETVDQRISNYWHLVLVGLRDAGWRTTSGEAPRELAKRLDIESVERAAKILERARHGVGIDAEDLAEMGEVSEQAYRASRARTSVFARAIGWFRRPLV